MALEGVHLSGFLEVVPCCPGPVTRCPAQKPRFSSWGGWRQVLQLESAGLTCFAMKRVVSAFVALAALISIWALWGSGTQVTPAVTPDTSQAQVRPVKRGGLPELVVRQPAVAVAKTSAGPSPASELGQVPAGGLIRMRGRVTFKGQPIEALVMAFRPGTMESRSTPKPPVAQVMTDSVGRYEFDVPPSVELVAKGEGVQCAEYLKIERVTTSEISNLDIELYELAKATLRVVDSDGRAVEGAELSSARHWLQLRMRTGSQVGVTYKPVERKRSGVSGARGLAEVEELKLGRRYFSAEKDGAIGHTWVDELGPEIVEIKIQRPAEDGVRVFGKIEDPEGRPVSQAEVRVDNDLQQGGFATSAADGSFELRVKQSSRHYLLGVDAREFPFLQVPLGEIHEETGAIQVRLDPGFRIEGKLVMPDGAAVPEEHLVILGEPLVNPKRSLQTALNGLGLATRDEAFTDSEGRFVFRGLDSRSYLVYAENDDGVALLRITAPKSDARVVIGEVKEACVRFGGVVRHFLTGRPVEGVGVMASLRPFDSEGRQSQGYSSTRTDAEGRYEVIGAVAGHYAIHVSRDGFAGETSKEQSCAIGEYQVNLHVVPVRSLRVTVLDPDGEPVNGADVWTENLPAASPDFGRGAGRGISGRTGADGVAHLHGHPALRLNLHTRPSLFQVVASQLIDLSAEGLHEFEVRLGVWPMRGGDRTITVDLVDGQGELLALAQGCTITVFEAGERIVGRMLCAWQDGVFSCLREGESSTPYGGRKITRAIVRASDKTRRLRIDIPGRASLWVDVPLKLKKRVPPAADLRVVVE